MKGEEKVNNFVPDCAHERWVACEECDGTGKIELTEDRMVDLRRDEDRVPLKVLIDACVLYYNLQDDAGYRFSCPYCRGNGGYTERT